MSSPLKCVGMIIILLIFPSVVIAHHNRFPTSLAQHPYYRVLEKHHPDATGKVYLEREIAEVMGPGGIDWLEREERESEEKVSQLIKALPLKAGMQVADIGVGSGYVARKLAPKVLPGGRIWAVDIEEAMLRKAEDLARKEGIKNLRTVLGTIEDPKLKSASLDLALMVDVYHEFSHPYEMMQAISRALKPGGWLVLVEYRAEDPKVPIKATHKMSLQQIQKEMALPEFRLRFHSVDKRLPRQHIVFFQKERA